MISRRDALDAAQRCRFCGRSAEVRHAVDCPDPEFLSPQSDSLDVAWAEVEAALPDGDWFFRVGQTPVADDYDARAMYAPTGYAEEGRGDTPAAALRALAAMLRER